jgi:ubiquinone/menaquinone biosynthesis C-methylase UbiE
VLAQYSQVAVRPDGRFPYATGQAGALAQGYADAWLVGVDAAVVERFVGVGNPFSAHTLRPGDRVLDVGCGAGLDVFVAARLVGPAGRVSGIDISADMLAFAVDAAAAGGIAGVQFLEADAAQLPFGDGAFDVIVSNGALNLVPDKDAAFREIARVLRPDGVLAVADLLAHETVPDDVLADPHAWST